MELFGDATTGKRKFFKGFLKEIKRSMSYGDGIQRQKTKNKKTSAAIAAIICKMNDLGE